MTFLDRRFRTATPAGYTLVELLVVLTVVALLVVAVPTLTAGLPSLRLRAEAARLSETMRQARDDAVRGGADTEIAFDPVARRYVVLPSQAMRDMASVIDRLDVAVDSVWHGERTVRVRFFADGSATAATIRLWRGKRAQTISVDWPTGRVVRRD